MTDYIFARGDIYYYRRRVPEFVQPYESRSFVKISLGTKDPKEAQRKASIYNDYIEDFWRNLIKVGGSDNPSLQYRSAIQLAKAHGFTYMSVAEIARAPLHDLITRVHTASSAIDSPATVSSILGGVERPQILLSECLEKFWPLSADRLFNKSEHQIRKWKNPRILAMGALIQAIGDKELATLSRRDILQFRQWWMERIDNGEVIASTVNKNIIAVRDVLQIVGTQYEIETDFEVLFAKTKLKQIDQSRPSFEVKFVQDVLLSPNNLRGLNTEARLLIHAMADTGARESELVGLQKEDIFLHEAIPYIWIRPRKNHALKTLTSERKIPLVGSALHAFQQLPKGFQHYRNADTVSTTINKYLRQNNLKPTPRHSLYSLRHTFKDRLRDVQAPEEVIDELMGHKKSGPKYGRGHILERKYEWMKQIAFKV